MRRMIARRMVISGLTLAVALAIRPVFSAEKPPSERLLPQRTYFYVTVPSVGELKTRFGQSLTGQMLREPKLADFMADIHKKFEQLGEEFQKKIGLKLGDVLAVPDGEISLAVLLPTDAKKLAVAGILDFGKGSSSTVAALLEKISTAMEKNGFKKSTRDFEGAQLTVYNKEKKKEGDDKKDGGSDSEKSEEPEFGSQFAYVVKGDTLVVTSGVVAVQDILKRWDGKHSETLAEVPSYKAIVENSKQPGAPPVVLWYVNPVTLVDAFIRSSESADQGVAMAMAFLPALGVDNLKAIGGSFHLGTENFDSENRILINLERPASGLLSVFQFPAVKQAPPNWVTDDATAYIGINWDVANAYKAVEALVDQILGPGATAQKLDEWAEDANGPKIHIKKDIVDNLDGVIHIATDSPDTGKTEGTRVLVALGLKDAKKMKAVLEKVVKMPNFPGKAADFKGQTIFNLDPLPVFGDANRTMGAALVGDQLMFSNDVSRIEQVIIADKDRKPLADSEKYKKVAKHFPPKTSILWFQEQDNQFKQVYELFRSGKVAEFLGNTPFGPVVEGIDFKKLPEFDVLRKYLPASGSYAVPQGNGAVFISFTPKTSVK